MPVTDPPSPLAQWLPASCPLHLTCFLRESSGPCRERTAGALSRGHQKIYPDKEDEEKTNLKQNEEQFQMSREGGGEKTQQRQHSGNKIMIKSKREACQDQYKVYSDRPIEEIRPIMTKLIEENHLGNDGKKQGT